MARNDVLKFPASPTPGLLTTEGGDLINVVEHQKETKKKRFHSTLAHGMSEFSWTIGEPAELTEQQHSL